MDECEKGLEKIQRQPNISSVAVVPEYNEYDAGVENPLNYLWIMGWRQVGVGERNASPTKDLA